ncbi:AAA domain-containing protein [Haloechinothrix alba]|uniref:AAA domain-containing protein n=1 Tax=Haloechinothrix alba TaxID=664784 RepID=A0A238WTG6_9PSEU|nr:AAA family ATPase [Haloechinothrix alba]SNR49693.1 AAA domain-containing protein [Haloechinothrix alba]
MTNYDHPFVQTMIEARIIDPPDEPDQDTPIGDPVDVGNPRAAAYIRGLYDGCLSDVEKAPEGERNNTLYVKANKLGRFVAAGYIREGEVRGQLESVGRTAGLGEVETRKTVNSGLTDGRQHPKTLYLPPRDGEVTTNGQVEDEPSEIDRRMLEIRQRLLTVDGLRHIPPPEPLVENYLYRDSLAWLHGKPGHGKSFLAVDLACCVATGTPWHGHTATPGRVLYLIAEGAAGLSRRVDAWSLAHGSTVEHITFLPVPVQLLQHIDTAAFTRLLGELQPDLVVIDTQARVTLGGEENSSRDMGTFVDALEQLRTASGACILVVHHEPRNGDNLRGSTALEGAATTILRTEKDGQLVKVTNPKQKEAPEQGELKLSLLSLGESAVYSHGGVGVDAQLAQSEIDLLNTLWEFFGSRGAITKELRAVSGMSETTFYRALNSLVTQGLVSKYPEGAASRYIPTNTTTPTTPIDSQAPVGVADFPDSHSHHP